MFAMRSPVVVALRKGNVRADAAIWQIEGVRFKLGLIKAKGRFRLEPPFALSFESLTRRERSLPASPWGPYDVELNRLAFLQRAEAVALNRGVMDENVLTGRAAQKSKTLGVVKPFYCSCFHDLVLFSIQCTAETQCGSCLRVVRYNQNKQEHQIGFYDPS